MDIYGDKALTALLEKIANGQTEVSGDEVGLFESLLMFDFVSYGSIGANENYESVCTTIDGEAYLNRRGPFPDRL